MTLQIYEEMCIRDRLKERVLLRRLRAGALAHRHAAGPVSYTHLLTPEEFYAKMRSADKLPTTSQANPMQFEEVFSRHLAQGEDIVAVTVSSKLRDVDKRQVLCRPMGVCAFA